MSTQILNDGGVICHLQLIVDHVVVDLRLWHLLLHLLLFVQLHFDLAIQLVILQIAEAINVKKTSLFIICTFGLSWLDP